MKKILAVLTVLVLVLTCAAAIGENATAKYEEIVAGEWNAVGYFYVSSSSSFGGAILGMDYFTFPSGDGSWSNKGTFSVDCFGYLTGDETGRVDMTLSFGDDVLVGRVSLSSDGTRMNIETPNGTTFFFRRK